MPRNFKEMLKKVHEELNSWDGKVWSRTRDVNFPALILESPPNVKPIYLLIKND